MSATEPIPSDPATSQEAVEASRSPLAELLLIAVPTIAQMVSYTLMQFVDTAMLSRLGTDQPTAAGNAGMLAWTFISMGVGVTSIVNTLVSHHYGKGDHAHCGRYLWQGIWFAIGYSALVGLVIPFAPRFFLGMGHEPALAGMEAVYFQICLAAVVLKLASSCLGQFLLGINRSHCLFIASAIGVSVNAVVAWALILGHFGAPRLGIVGAAWATNVGVTVELAVLTWFVLQRATRMRYGPLAWRPKGHAMWLLLKLGVPAGVQMVGEVLAWTLFATVVLNVFGTQAMAANTFVFRYMSVSFMPAWGMSIAATSLVGRYIGRGEPEVAVRRTNLAFLVTLAYMTVCGGLFFLGRHWLISRFAEDAEVIRLGSRLMVFGAFYQFFDGLYIIYSGGLRGAGDTFTPAVVLIIMNWTITVLGGYWIARELPQLGVLGPWMAASVYGIALGVFCWLRFRAQKWRSIRLTPPDLDD